MSETCNESSCSSCSVEGCSSRKAADMKEPANQYSHIKHVIGVVSGKGGVGKSLVTSELAVKLHRQGYKVGVLDADITGPSIPKVFGIHEKAVGNDKGVFPAQTPEGIKIISVNLMKVKSEEVVRQNEMMVQKVDKLEQVLKQVVKMLATNTNYASLITAPQSQKNKLKFIQLTRVNEEQILAVMMLEGNIIKNKILTVDELVEEEEVVKLNLLLNTYLQGLSLQEINMELLQTMKRQAQGHRKIISDLIDTIVEAFLTQNFPLTGI